jgi:hypothetical protein
MRHAYDSILANHSRGRAGRGGGSGGVAEVEKYSDDLYDRPPAEDKVRTGTVFTACLLYVCACRGGQAFCLSIRFLCVFCVWEGGGRVQQVTFTIWAISAARVCLLGDTYFPSTPIFYTFANLQCLAFPPVPFSFPKVHVPGHGLPALSLAIALLRDLCTFFA